MRKLFKIFLLMFFCLFFKGLSDSVLGIRFGTSYAPQRFLMRDNFKIACRLGNIKKIKLCSKYSRINVDEGLQYVFDLQRFRNDVENSKRLSAVIKAGANVNSIVKVSDPNISLFSEPISVPLFIATILIQDIENIKLIINNPKFNFNAIKNNPILGEELFIGRIIKREVFELLNKNSHFNMIFNKMRAKGLGPLVDGPRGYYAR